MRAGTRPDRIFTHKVYDIFEKVQYTFLTRAAPNRAPVYPVRDGWIDRLLQEDRHEGLHFLGYAPFEGGARCTPTVPEVARSITPLRFEAFEAQDRSSREACLAGVDQADV